MDWGSKDEVTCKACLSALKRNGALAMTVTLDETLLPMLDRVTVVLADYDAVTQQKVLALTTVRHAMRARPRSFRCGLYAQTRHAADRRIGGEQS